MMQECDSQVFKEFASRIREILPGSRILAYGSRARGDATPDSDFDICVVFPDAATDARKQIQEIAWEVGFDHELLIMALSYSETEFNQSVRVASSLMRNIRKEGIAA